MTAKLTNTFAEYNKDPLVLLEGGLYGHMSHIYEDPDLTFKDLKDIISQVLQGHIRSIKEKVDGQALAVSMDRDGNVIFARNKGHIRDFGENALKWKGVSAVFADRGDLTNAFSFAAKDLAKALAGLNRDTQELRFGRYDARVPKLNKGGQPIQDEKGEIVYETVTVKRWLNFEIVWPETTNVIPYNHRLIILHNYDAFDKDGIRRESDFNEFAETIRQDLEKVNKLIQKRFTISTMPLLALPEVRNFEDSKDEFTLRVNQFRDEFNLTDINTLSEYYSIAMKNIIMEAAGRLNYMVTEQMIDVLINRWLNGVGSPNIREILKSVHDKDTNGGDAGEMFKEWIRSTDSRDMKAKLLGDIKGPMKTLFVDLGVEVMNNMNDFLALNPSEATIQMRDAIEKVVDQVEATEDLQHTKKIEKYLRTIHKAGGLDNIVPSEGLTFTYKKENSNEHSVYKLTGAFADINQIIGFFKYSR